MEDLEPHKLGTSFSISTWMKHYRETQDIKEHVLCAADGEGEIIFCTFTVRSLTNELSLVT